MFSTAMKGQTALVSPQQDRPEHPVRNCWASCDAPSAWGLDIVCASPYSAISPPWGLENTCALGLGIQGWSHPSSLPPERTQCNSMQGHMGCQVTDLNGGSRAPTGLIPLEGDLVDMASYLLPAGKNCSGTATSTSPSSHRVLPFCRPFTTWEDGR